MVAKKNPPSGHIFSGFVLLVFVAEGPLETLTSTRRSDATGCFLLDIVEDNPSMDVIRSVGYVILMWVIILILVMQLDIHTSFWLY